MQRLEEGWFSVIRRRIAAFCVVALGVAAVAMAQDKVTIKGKVVDASGEVLPGVSVIVSGTTTGTVTDFDGNYSLVVPAGSQVVYSFVGFDNQTIAITAGQNVYNVTMEDSAKALDEVVVVGYGQQKKESIVGAITQTTGEVLERAAGIANVGQALTGNLPGVVTLSSTGMPGEEQPKIIIRGSTNDPLVLVDGVERDMTSVDMSSVESLSVLKDASATAVFGVKGANGVILITTKRGREGKAQINVQANAILKMVSKLPNKMDAYDALVARNVAIEHEANITDSWSAYRPMSFIQNYRNQEGKYDEKGNLISERYPNVDWQDVLFKKRAMSYNANINVSGGSKVVRYFASLDYVNEGDLFNVFENNRGYDSGYSYNRIGTRSNLDFNLTSTTLLKVGIAGSMGIRKCPLANDGDEWQMAQRWAGAYNISPDAFMPQYADGGWGFLPGSTNVTNSAQNLAMSGSQSKVATTITTDFTLEQDLSFLVDGLNLRGTISWDNGFQETGRGVNDMYKGEATIKYINPDTGNVTYKTPYDAYNRFDTQEDLPGWTTSDGSVQDWATRRRFNYQVQLNYNHKFADKHNVGAMGVFQRDEYAQGNMIPSYRENWVFRLTYDFAGRYFVEYNGAYNGSEKYSKDNRFVFFNSGAIGWLISGEPFMQSLVETKIVDMLKIRGSIGEIGDDSKGDRFAYISEWSYGGKIKGLNPQSPDEEGQYEWYRQANIGNADLKWETVTKMNIGLDYAFLDGLLAGNVEIFKDKRTDMVMTPAMPSYYGMNAASINYGEMTTKGYEIELRVSKALRNGIRLWGNFNMTHAENVVDKITEPELYPSYRKQVDYASGQTRSHISNGFVNTYDDLYGTTKYSAADNQKLLGDYHIMDFDGNGVIDDNDAAPYGYTSTPQNTYNATIGADWKGWNFFVQFYGVNNVTRDVTMTSFGNKLNTVYDMGSWWTEERGNAEYTTPRYNSTPSYENGTQYLEDASYIRLKNIELGYTFNKNFNFMQKLHFNSMKLFVSGNNLWVWTNMPDDRESNIGGSAGQGAYPTVKRINFGLKFSL